MDLTENWVFTKECEVHCRNRKLYLLDKNILNWYTITLVENLNESNIRLWVCTEEYEVWYLYFLVNVAKYDLGCFHHTRCF